MNKKQRKLDKILAIIIVIALYAAATLLAWEVREAVLSHNVKDTRPEVCRNEFGHRISCRSVAEPSLRSGTTKPPISTTPKSPSI